MNSSPSISNLTKALLKAQREMGAAVKGANNPFFKSKYADLGAVMEAVKGPLNDNGVLVLQPATFRDGRNFISTTLIHGESGEFITSETEVICAKQNDPQAFVAAQTYARRAGLQAMTFTPAEDDDGNTAANRYPKAAPAAKAAPTPTPTSEASSTTTVTVTNNTTTATPAAAVAPLNKSKFGRPKAAETAAPAAVAVGEDSWG
jgi:hypothetical protein